MIPKSGYRFRKRSCSKHNLERDGDSKKSHLALAAKPLAGAGSGTGILNLSATAQDYLFASPPWGVSSVAQDESRDQLHCGEDISGKFVVAGRNGAEVRNFIEEAFDEVALAVKREVALSL